VKPQSPIARALDEFLTERRNLVARLEKVDALIASTCEVFHLPVPALDGRRNGTPAPAAVDAPARRARSQIGDAIRSALKDGPLSPGDLAEKVGVTRGRLRYQVLALEQSGVIVSTGTTANRQIALAGTPAKEAP